MLSFTLHVNCLAHIFLHSVFLSLHETAIKHHQVTSSSSYFCKFEFIESSAVHCWLILIHLFAIFLYLLTCSAFSESLFYILLREWFIFVQLKNILLENIYQNIPKLSISWSSNTSIQMFSLNEKLHNISGKLQIINGKFQNNAINNVKQTPSNGVINGIIDESYRPLSTLFTKKMRI